MIFIREFFATAFFFTAIGFVFSAFYSDDALESLFISAVFFVSAYFLWPSKNRGHRHDDNWILENVLEFLVELPIECVKFICRIVFRSFRSSDLDIDV